MDGKPYVKGLEEFGKVVLEDLWGALLKQFVEVRDFKNDRQLNIEAILSSTSTNHYIDVVSLTGNG